MNARPLVKVHRERGVSLLEALITILILAFGILGLASLNASCRRPKWKRTHARRR